MNDVVWPDLDRWNRIGQDFGFERSPLLHSPLFMADWVSETDNLSNQESWIIHGLRVMADKESQTIDSAPVASAIGVDFPEGTDLFLNSSFALGCRVGQKPAANFQGPVNRVWRKATTPCVSNARCGKPRFCDQGFQTPALNKKSQPIQSTPTRSSTPSTMLGTTIVRNQASDSDIAQFVASVANDLAPETAPFDPSVLEGFVRANRTSGRWKLNHIGGGILFGYKASANRVRIVNRDVRDFIDVQGNPLDIGPQAAFDIANQVASQAGLAILGLSEEQIGADTPTLNVVIDGHGSSIASDHSVFGYVFSMFRMVNGYPVLDLENTIVIHRSGQMYYSDITAAGVSTQGPPSLETSTTGQVFEVPFGFGDFDNLFRTEFKRYFGTGNSPTVVWSGFAYIVTHAGVVEPVFVVRFVPAGKGKDGIVGDLRTWASRVSDPFAGFVELPYSRLAGC